MGWEGGVAPWPRSEQNNFVPHRNSKRKFVHPKKTGVGAVWEGGCGCTIFANFESLRTLVHPSWGCAVSMFIMSIVNTKLVVTSLLGWSHNYAPTVPAHSLNRLCPPACTPILSLLSRHSCPVL